ncbi:MAG: hypothetical protein IJB90_01865 [Clostridia bacterium]|nr:hypothetical protein [Clostridia bacterium]
MKNTSILIILAIIFIIICLVSVNIINLQSERRQIQKQNLEYEKYLNKEILGTDVATLISKVVDSNEKNDVQKDQKEYYIDNKENSIKIDLKMTTIDKTYPMEEIYNNKIKNFVQNFNLIKFKCTSIEYHKKTGKISKLLFEELQ